MLDTVQRQVEAVAAVLEAVRSSAAQPTNYLLQHATGSGKSLTIALLASHLLQVWLICMQGVQVHASGLHVNLPTCILGKLLTEPIVWAGADCQRQAAA
jgi:hypothetical protein